jgi:transposase
VITLGIDPSRKNFCVSFTEKMVEFDYQEYENSPRGYELVLKRIRSLKSKPVVCIEGYGDFAKQLSIYLKCHQLEIYEINPKKSQRLKESITEHKTDHIDAFACSLFPYFHKELDELSVDMQIEGLKNLCRLFEKASKSMTKYKNQFHAALNQSFGQIYKQFFKNFNKTSFSFFKEYGSFEEIESATVGQIHNCLKKGGSCMFKGKKGLQRSVHIKSVVDKMNYHPLIEFEGIQSEVVKSYARMLLTIQENIEAIKRSIEKYVDDSFPPFQHLFSDLKGVSRLQFARLITEIRNMNMFKSEAKLAAFAGQAPRRSQSGSYDNEKKRNAYNRHLAYMIHMIACTNVRKGDRFFEEYSMMKEKYNRNLRALKNIKRKVVRLIYYKLKEYWKLMDDSKAIKGDSINAA